jgi:ATP-dependent DNA ligase
MDLPVMPPLAPMLAKPVSEVPVGDYLYEPKWDGFRCILFRDGNEVELGSRNERPLTRYFPEVVAAALASLPARCVVDAEIIIAGDGRLDFEALQQRIHPAASRVRLLAEQTPASLVVFDLLALGSESLMDLPFAERRTRLEEARAGERGTIHLTPATRDAVVARDWFARFEGAGLDGVIAKPLADRYQPNVRAMTKVKHARTADCVVAGFRWHKSGGVVGSLLLGLYDDAGRLQHVGVAGAFTMARRRELVDELAPYRTEDLRDHPWGGWSEAAPSDGRRPGAVSRWNAKKDLSFEPLRPDLVCEVGYDVMQGTRFRHIARFRHWRTDRDPLTCGYDQLERAEPLDLAQVLAAADAPMG